MTISEGIKEAITHLDNLSNAELMRRYMSHKLNRYPSTIELDAIGYLFKQRDISFIKLETIAHFTQNGKHKTIDLVGK